MARNDEGEFELVLGNKQLLSVFFIVVVLLAVFFTSGYIVGRSTAGAQMAAAPDRPIVVEPDAEAAAPPPQETAAAKPAPDTASPPPARVEQPKPAAALPPTPPKPKPTPASTSRIGEPAPGEVYLQVVATKLPEAEVLLSVLQKRGFEGRLAAVPGQDLYRVLIGPVSGPDDLSETRTKLQSAGFQPFTRPY